jgi:hypothetical protein
LPFIPTRSGVSAKMGPGDVSLIATTVTITIGEKTIKSTVAPTMSTVLLKISKIILQEYCTTVLSSYQLVIFHVRKIDYG